MKTMNRVPSRQRPCLRPLALPLALLLCLAPAHRAGAAPANPSLPGDAPLELFPDSASLRAALYDEVLAGPRDSVLARKPQALENEWGRFRLSTTRGGDAFYLVLSAARGKDWPLYSQGSWIIKRSMEDGRFLQAKIFLRSDPGCFVRIYPDGDRCLMDVLLHGAVLNREVPIPTDFDRLLGLPLATLVEWTKAYVDWELFSPRPGDYAGLEAFAAAIRKGLPGLRYADDGGLDAEGKPVFIATGAPMGGSWGLNCSGFAQWVVDGLITPTGGEWPDASILKEKHPELRGASVDPAIDERYDPFFGLDWTRNLGLALAESSSPWRRHVPTENDIRLSAFAQFAPSTDAVNGGPPYEAYPAYDVDSGYPIRGLKAILHILAIREPGEAYLASFSRPDRTGLRRHYHVALLLPRFDDTGIFRVDVFESAAETSLDAILTRAPKDFVHLVAIHPGRDFEPPVLR